MDDQGAAGMKMASNSSLHSVRVEQKGNSCLLVLVWLTIIIITFTAGGTGPDVLEKGAHGAVINATYVDQPQFETEDGFLEGDDEVNEKGTVTHHHKTQVAASVLSFAYTPRRYKVTLHSSRARAMSLKYI